jgi:hypothetical protein
MALFSSTVRPSQTAIGIGGQRASIFQSVFPNLRQPDATGMFSNPAMIPHLPMPNGQPARANSPATPPPEVLNPTIHKSAATRAAEAVAAHLAAYPPPVKPPTVIPTRQNTAPRETAGTRNTNMANQSLQALGLQPLPGSTLPLASPQMRNPTGPSLNTLFPTR